MIVEKSYTYENLIKNLGNNKMFVGEIIGKCIKKVCLLGKVEISN